MINVMLLQPRYAQPCMSDLTKPGEVAVNMTGNTNSTVYGGIL